MHTLTLVTSTLYHLGDTDKPTDLPTGIKLPEEITKFFVDSTTVALTAEGIRLIPSRISPHVGRLPFFSFFAFFLAKDKGEEDEESVEEIFFTETTPFVNERDDTLTYSRHNNNATRRREVYRADILLYVMANKKCFLCRYLNIRVG